MERRGELGRRDFLRTLAGGMGVIAAGCAAFPEAVPADDANPVKLGPNASLGGRRVFPADNPWNTDISREPVDPKSDVLIAGIGLAKGLHPEFGTVYQGAPNGIPYVVVPGNQPRVPVKFRYVEDSDPGPYPIPPEAPIEGGPEGKGDRHMLVIDRDNWKLYELFAARPDPQTRGWTAGSGAIFDLNSNRLRSAGWTSADAAGLPIFPGLVRYDEVMEQKEIRHALRFTCQRTRRAYVAPARHYASRHTDENLPPMGMRVRLRAGFGVSRFPPEVQVILRALKKYGMFLADNGAEWFITGAPDRRWDDERLATLKRVSGREFEVVKMGPVTTK